MVYQYNGILVERGIKTLKDYMRANLWDGCTIIKPFTKRDENNGPFRFQRNPL